MENMRFFCTFVKLNSIIKRCGNGQNIVAADFIIEVSGWKPPAAMERIGLAQISFDRKVEYRKIEDVNL